jgi:kelch-like protein 10
MKLGRKAHSAIYLKGFIYVFGGFVDGGVTKTGERFDISKGTWSGISPMFSSMAYTTPLVYGEQFIFLIGGYSGTKINGVR